MKKVCPGLAAGPESDAKLANPHSTAGLVELSPGVDVANDEGSALRIRENCAAHQVENLPKGAFAANSESGAEILKKNRKKKKKHKGKGNDARNLSVKEIQDLHPQRKIIARGKSWKVLTESAKSPANNDLLPVIIEGSDTPDNDISSCNKAQHVADISVQEYAEPAVAGDCHLSEDTAPVTSDVVTVIVDSSISYFCPEQPSLEYISDRSSSERAISIERDIIDIGSASNATTGAIKSIDDDRPRVPTDNDDEVESGLDIVPRSSPEVLVSSVRVPCDNLAPTCDNTDVPLSQPSSGPIQLDEVDCEDGYVSSREDDDVSKEVSLEVADIREGSPASANIRDEINRIIGNRINLSNLPVINVETAFSVDSLSSEPSTPRQFVESDSKSRSPSREKDGRWQQYLYQYNDELLPEYSDGDVDFVSTLHPKPTSFDHLTYISDSSAGATQSEKVSPGVTDSNKSAVDTAPTRGKQNIVVNSSSSFDSVSDQEIYGNNRKKERKRVSIKSRKSLSIIFLHLHAKYREMTPRYIKGTLGYTRYTY